MWSIQKQLWQHFIDQWGHGYIWKYCKKLDPNVPVKDQLDFLPDKVQVQVTLRGSHLMLPAIHVLLLIRLSGVIQMFVMYHLCWTGDTCIVTNTRLSGVIQMFVMYHLCWRAERVLVGLQMWVLSMCASEVNIKSSPSCQKITKPCWTIVLTVANSLNTEKL